MCILFYPNDLKVVETVGWAWRDQSRHDDKQHPSVSYTQETAAQVAAWRAKSVKDLGELDSAVQRLTEVSQSVCAV